MKLYSKADGIKKVKSMKATGGAKVYKIKRLRPRSVVRMLQCITYLQEINHIALVEILLDWIW